MRIRKDTIEELEKLRDYYQNKANVLSNTIEVLKSNIVVNQKIPRQRYDHEKIELAINKVLNKTDGITISKAFRLVQEIVPTATKSSVSNRIYRLYKEGKLNKDTTEKLPKYSKK